MHYRISTLFFNTFAIAFVLANTMPQMSVLGWPGFLVEHRRYGFPFTYKGRTACGLGYVDHLAAIANVRVGVIYVSSPILIRAWRNRSRLKF